MKTLVLAAALLGGALRVAEGQGAIYLNNFDAWAGLFFGPGTTPAAAGTMVMISGGTNLASLTPVSSEGFPGQTVFSATYVLNGLNPYAGTFFDAGYGLVPGVPAYGSAFIELLAWYGAADFAAAKATSGAWWYEVRWAQNVGSGWFELPTPGYLEIPVPIHMHPGGIPEPSPAALAGLAVACLVVRRWCHWRRPLHLPGK